MVSWELSKTDWIEELTGIQAENRNKTPQSWSDKIKKIQEEKATMLYYILELYYMKNINKQKYVGDNYNIWKRYLNIKLLEASFCSWEVWIDKGEACEGI